VNLLGARRAVGLDVGSEAVRALAVERKGKGFAIAGGSRTPIQDATDPAQLGQAINAALASAGGEGAPIIASISGPDIVIRQVSLPVLPHSRILAALEMQHREFGLLPPDEAVLDAQLVRRSKDGTSTEVLAVAAPRVLVEERSRLFQQASVKIQTLDVEALALLNAAVQITGMETGELLVAVTIGQQRTVLSLLSDQGPVVARYLEVGAEDFLERLRIGFDLSPYNTEQFARSISEAALPRAEEVCRDVLERIAEDIRLSLAFYRSEYDRESLPRYALGGWLELRQIGRWLAERLGPGTQFEVLDPLQAMEVKRQPAGVDADTMGSQFLQAFGLALRGL
jgi:type IV pilus assembly protein PilM